MANEIVAADSLTYRVDYEKPKITFHNFEELKAHIEERLTKYESLAVTPDTKTDIKHSIAELRSLRKAVDSRRKEIKKDYEAPLKEFETKVKALTGLIDNTVSPLNDKVKAIEDQEREERRNEVIVLISEMAPNYDLIPSEIEIENEWLNKISKAKLTKLIGDRMGWLQNEKCRIKADRDATTAYAKQAGFDPEGWTALVEQGQGFDAIRLQIDSAAMKRKQEQDRQAKIKESADAIAKLNRATVETNTGQTNIDLTTGEIVEPKFTRAMRVTATEKQMWALARYMDDNKIKYESLKEV